MKNVDLGSNKLQGISNLHTGKRKWLRSGSCLQNFSINPIDILPSPHNGLTISLNISNSWKTNSNTNQHMGDISDSNHNIPPIMELHGVKGTH